MLLSLTCRNLLCLCFRPFIIKRCQVPQCSRESGDAREESRNEKGNAMGETAIMITSRSRISEIVVWVIVVAMPAAAAQSQEIRAGEEAARNADGQRKEFISSLVEIKDSPDECYDTLKRRLLEGHFDDVKAGLDLRDDGGRRLFEGYRFAQLRALCARAIFRRYSYRKATSGWPTERHGLRLRELARETTAAYEDAFRLAPSDFERSRVYARWHEVHALRRFEADSLLLRSGSPLEYRDKPVDEVLSEQILRLRSTAARALDSTEANGRPLEADVQAVFLDVLSDEYRTLGRIGVPEEVFREVLNDLPELLQQGIHPSVLAEPETRRVMIRYHLWYALTGPRPDEIDDEFINWQVQTVDKWIRERFTKELSSEDTNAASARFLKCVGLVRHNCFLPRFKRPLWPFEWSEPKYEGQKSTEDEVVTKIDQAVTRIFDGVDRAMSRPGTRNIEKTTRREIELGIKSMIDTLTMRLTKYQHLTYLRQPPGVIITLRSGTTHDQSGVWIYTGRKPEPVPPYPWKKIITPVDSCTASTRQIAKRALKALGQGDTATLDALVSESRDFSKPDIHRLAGVLNDKFYTSKPERMQEIKDLLIEKPWSWSAVSVKLPTDGADKMLALVFRWKHRSYWLAWAGLVEGFERKSLADMLTRLKPDLELPPVLEPVEFAKPVDIVPVDNVSEMKSLEPIDAGHSWRVQLALTEGDAAAPWKLLYCRAEWTDQDRPTRPVPFGRYIGRHLGPVVWTISSEGFRETGPDLNSRPAPPMSIEGNGAVYAATLPLGGFKQGYLQVYSAFDGREMARRCITVDKSSTWLWGRFMEQRTDKPFGVSVDFVAACPGMPAFKPMPVKPTGQSGPSISLSVKGGFLSLSSDKQILPTRGSRLLARWWLNGRPVSPKTAEEFAVAGDSHTEGLASLLRLPATLPSAVLKARPGDKVGLQVMLSPDRIESPAFNLESSQCISSLDIDGSPAVPLLSNRFDFKVNASIIAQRSSKPVTASSLKKLTEAISKENTRVVRRLLSEYPQLANTPDASGRSALEIVCYQRPRAKHFGPIKIGGDVTVHYWKNMSEIARILIDYGADVNAKTNMRQTLLLSIMESERFDPDDAPPVELMRALLERGANTEFFDYHGTVLQHAIKEAIPRQPKIVTPIVKVLLDYDADVLAVCEPRNRESVYERVDELTEKGHVDVAALIGKHGAIRRKTLGLAVRAGVEEFLGRVRNADEKMLLTLENELPWVSGIDFPRLCRNIQNEHGSDLKDIGSIARMCLRGDWAEVTLPTGRKGDKAYVHIVLMRYPGGAYHAVQAGWTDGSDFGSRTRHISSYYGELMTSVYSAFGLMHKCKVSGGRSTGYPRHFTSILICGEQDRLVVRGRNVPSWTHFHVEITPDTVWHWDEIWALNLSSNMTFATDDRKMLMADGILTVRNRDKIVVFTSFEGQVRMEADGRESLGSEFVLDLKTLEVEP